MRAEYKELLALTRLYLLREYETKEWKLCEPEVFAYFKQLAHAHPLPKQKTQAPPPPKPTAPPLPKKIEEKKTTPIKKPPPKKELELEPVKHTPMEDFSDLRKIFQEKFPSQRLLQEPPSDASAKAEEMNWEQIPDVLILSTDPKADPFLVNMAKAISVEWGTAFVLPAARLEREERWNTYLQADALKLIIACDYGIYTFKHLMKHYREDAKAARHYLGKKPLLLLSDPSLYRKEPKLKPLLWKALCDMF